MSPLFYLSIAEAAALIRQRKLSPVELTKAHLDRISALDSHLRSYITVAAELAMQQARKAEIEISRKQYRGALHGIPLSYKDIIDTAGIRTTAASAIHAHSVPGRDAAVVRRLGEAGAVTLGKANLFEFAWTGTSEDDLFKPALNPWNLQYSPGGSSSGSAAGVAAGLAMASVASDSGGSIRNPAARCGLTGLKPTYGRVGRSGVFPLSYSFDTVGPLARSAEDVAILLEALAGYDAQDAASSQRPVPEYPKLLSRSLRGLKVGICPSFMEATGVDREVFSAFWSALEVFRSLGVAIHELTIPSLHYARAATWTILRIEGFHVHFKNLREHREKLGPSFLRNTAIGGFLSTHDYLRAQRARALIAADLQRTFQSVDLLVMPTNPKTAGPASYGPGERDPKVALSGEAYVTPFNVNGSPALAIPSGFNAIGLPTSIQIAGRPFEEGTVLALAQQYQLATDWHRRRPPIEAGLRAFVTPRERKAR